MSVVIDVTADAQPVIISVSGEFDLNGVNPLRTAVSDALIAGQLAFVVDLANATFIDSSGIGAMVAATRDVNRAGGTLVMTNAAGPVLRVLKLSGLTELIPLQE